jgi:hypothetical protein
MKNTLQSYLHTIRVEPLASVLIWKMRTIVFVTISYYFFTNLWESIIGDMFNAKAKFWTAKLG